jgi:hypothetical protein
MMLSRFRPLVCLAFALFVSVSARAQAALSPGSPWVFAGFKGNGEDGVYFALSLDGYHWIMANNGKPVIKPTQPGELMRDPFLQRDADGNFVMVWSWAWRGTTIGYSSSEDLAKWTAHQQFPVMATQPAALNTWAPAIYWEKSDHRWLIFWSSTIPGKFPGDDSGDGGLNHRIWYTTTRDLKTFKPAKVFFDPGYSVIDATLVATPNVRGGSYRLIFKDERKTPLEKHLLTAAGSSIEGPWEKIGEPFTETWSEGGAAITVPGGYLVYYDHYTQPQHYGAAFTADFRTFTDVTDKTVFPKGLRHGSFLQVTREEYEVLAQMK